MNRILTAIIAALARPLVSVAVVGLILVAAVMWLAGWLPFGGGIGGGRGTGAGDGGSGERRVEVTKPGDPKPKPTDPALKPATAAGVVETPQAVQVNVVIGEDGLEFEGKPIDLPRLGEVVRKLRAGRTDGKAFQIIGHEQPTTRTKPLEELEAACKAWGVQYVGPRTND